MSILTIIVLVLIWISRINRQNKMVKKAKKENYRCPHCYTLMYVNPRHTGVFSCSYCKRPMILRKNKIIKLDYVKCPYCNKGYDIEDGYYKCTCGHCFRKESENHSFKILKEDETINDVICSMISVLIKMLYKDKIINQDKLDFYTDLIEESFGLSQMQIQWCKEHNYIPSKPFNCQVGFYFHSIVGEIKFFKRNAREYCNEEMVENLSKLLLDMIINLAYFERKEDKEFESNAHLIYEELGLTKEFYLKIRSKIINTLHNSNYINIDQLHESYTILDLDTNASDQEIKKAYRKMMNIYHPDKHIHKNLSDEEMKKLNDKLLEIQSAYNLILEYKNCIN